MATNIPLGTYVQDGVRSGPFYTNRQPTTTVANNGNTIYVNNNWDNYGPGMLFSPQYTWNITPYAPGDGTNGTRNSTKFTNVVNTQAAGTIAAAGNLTLFGDNAVTYLNNGVIQFDWPRVVTVTIGVGNLLAPVRVTIFGTDWYGMPMQHTYVVQNVGTYPAVTLGNSGNNLNVANISVPAKAFYTVNQVYVSAAVTGNNATISLGAADIFGLPYLVAGSPLNGANGCNIGDITSINWGNASDLSVAPVKNPLQALGVFVGADLTVPFSNANPALWGLTGDVRGLYAPSSASTATFTVSGNNLRVTYYVSGADVWQNQVSNRQQLAILSGQYVNAGTVAAPINVYVPGDSVSPLNPTNLYGQPQFYTGQPS